MSWNYETYLKQAIYNAQRDTGIKDRDGNDYIIEVCSEQIFVTKKTLTPNTIYVVFKMLSSTNTLDAVTQPIQLLISCEQNDIQASQVIFSKFVSDNNFKAMSVDGTYIKQDYREPVVLSNFNEVQYGYRTLMYISGTLYLMDGLLDISTTDANSKPVRNAFTMTTGEGQSAVTEIVKPVNFNIAYSMTPNTQPIPPAKLATSVKSIASFAVTFTVPMTDRYEFIKLMAKIINGTESGNSDFTLSFNIGDATFNVPMKLVSSQITTAIDQVPGLQIGLIK